MMNIEKIKAEAQAAKESGFALMMGKPEIKLLLSMIPETNPPEVVQTICKTLFESGFDCGAADVAVKIMAAILKKGEQE